MSSDSVMRLADYVTLVRGTTYKGALVGKPGPALLGLGAIQPGGGFRDSDYSTYGGECPSKLMLGPGDLFASLKGATKDGKMIGSVARVPSLVPAGRLTQDTVKLNFIDSDTAAQQYIYWVLRTPQYREYCSGRAMGSAVVSLSREDFLSYPIPSLTFYRQQIVEALEGIEERVRGLHETSATLEAIAQAVFKSWFVDFAPVRAKAERRQLEGMDATTAALFPDSFEESELGLVPKGWSIGSVGDLASQKKGSVNPLTSPGVLYEHYSLPAFDSGQAPVFELGQEIKSNKTPLPEEAVLLSKLNPHIPRVWLPVTHGANAICSTEFLAYSPRDGASKELIYCLFGSSEFQQQLCQLVTGTSNSHQRVKPDQVLAVKVPIAGKLALKAFTEAVRPLFERIYANRLQAQILTKLRDTLLPRLISGQLRLSGAQALLNDKDIAQ